MIVSILGYAKSGKTGLGEAILRAVTGEGFTAAAIKAGRTAHQESRCRGSGHAGTPPSSRIDETGPSGPGTRPGSERLPDSRRLAAAGADPVILWTEAGAELEATGRKLTSEPLPSRERFRQEWERLLPAELTLLLRSRDLLLLEGRLLPGALVVQMKQQGSGAVKYALEEDELLICGEEEFNNAIEAILERLRGQRNAR